MPERIVVEVEQALGPGVDFEHDAHGVLVGRRARRGGTWLGFDRAVIVESDDGSGRGLPAMVALPGSTWAGCRLEVELVGGVRADGQTIVVTRPPGAPVGARPLMLAAAGIRADAEWLDRSAVDHVVREAYQQYRDRRSHARIQGGRAWFGVGDVSPELARFSTPHSLAEYNLARLPPRFVRGLEGLLDDDERLLYAIERPARIDVGFRERFRSARDRRAALLLLTDRQVLWLVDHSPPDRYLLDWGVDVTLAPVEQVTRVDVEGGDPYLSVRVVTLGESMVASLPRELAAEADVFVRLLSRFRPEAAVRQPRRRYEAPPIPFDPEPASRFGQADDACRLYDDLRRESAEPLAFLFSPAREGQRRPAGILVTRDGVTIQRDRERRLLELGRFAAISASLSPLVGRIVANADQRFAIAYPATLGREAGGVIRMLRTIWANGQMTPGAGSGRPP